MEVWITPTLTMQTHGNFRQGAHMPLAALRSSRAQWVDACSNTLLDLNPQWSLDRTRLLACDLWAELSHFDPVIAAEMEYESALSDA